MRGRVGDAVEEMVGILLETVRAATAARVRGMAGVTLFLVVVMVLEDNAEGASVTLAVGEAGGEVVADPLSPRIGEDLEAGKYVEVSTFFEDRGEGITDFWAVGEVGGEEREALLPHLTGAGMAVFTAILEEGRPVLVGDNCLEIESGIAPAVAVDLAVLVVETDPDEYPFRLDMRP